MDSTRTHYIVPLMLSIGVVIVAGLVVWLLLLQSQSQPYPETMTQESTVTAPRQLRISSFIGTIESIAVGEFTLRVARDYNPEIPADTTVRVRLSPNTYITRTQASRTIPSDAVDFRDYYRSAAVETDALRVGDIVNVRVEAQVWGSDAYDALSIGIHAVE